MIALFLTESAKSGRSGRLWEIYDYHDLSDQYDLLAILNHDASDFDRAIETLRESKRLCKKHRIEFDGQDILDDYLAERPSRHVPLIQPPTVESVSRQRSVS